MLIGEYLHNLDKKKRISLPSRMRKELGSKVVVTRGLDKCLFVYPVEEWQKIAEKLSNLPIGQARTRQFVRLMLAGAGEVEIDSLGRILIPDHLKNYAGLRHKAVITGMFTRAEIWDEEEWQKYRMHVEENADELAERLGELGVY
ncbi:division/cell wall cluster transcriptional repressor MraZ [Patescibacteria group bacterium]